MAISFSNQTLLASRLSASFSSSTPSKEPPSLPLRSLPTFKPTVGFSLSTHFFPSRNLPNCRGRAFRASLAAPTDNVGTLEEEEAENESLPSLEAILRVYKEALLTGDYKTVSSIESRIHVMENEKNTLERKVLELSAEITSGKENYIRLQADFDNFRKRSEKERLTTRSDAQGEVIESLLPMVDNFERAKQHIKPETEKEKKIDTSYQGIYKQFVEIMRSLQVSVVPTVGKPFDPSLHEAIAREESQEFKEGIIIQEFRRGFTLGDRLLRPAMVKVSSGPGKKRAPATSPDVDES